MRVVAATNADLQKLMAEGRFREDLYYRIGVVTLTLPPLRDREDDVVLIAEALARRYAAEAGRKLTGFSKDALQALRAHAWPGNVRELENRVRRAAVMAEGSRITAADLELAPGDDGRAPGPARAARRPRARDDQGRPQAQPRQHLADRLRARHQPPDALRPADQVQHRAAVAQRPRPWPSSVRPALLGRRFVGVTLVR